MLAMVDMGIEDYNAEGDGKEVKPLKKNQSLSNVMFSFARTLARGSAVRWGNHCK